MKKLFIISLITFWINVTSTQAQTMRYKDYSNDEISPRVISIIAGSAFILAGIFQRPDKNWVNSGSVSTKNQFNQTGYWQEETIFESPGRMASIGTGALILGLGFTIKF